MRLPARAAEELEKAKQKENIVEKALAQIPTKREFVDVEARLEALPGPAKAAKLLGEAVQNGLSAMKWVEQARVSAVLGSAPGSLDTIRSALRCWAGFTTGVLGPGEVALPPKPEWLCAWSRLFRNAKTTKNTSDT